jgi:hypothetical protein
MTTFIYWRPSTGADSVPFPADARLDGPAGAAAYSRYLVDCQEAAKRETAEEAVVRCRAEADLLDDGGQRFDDVLDCLTTMFDSHVRDLASNNAAIAELERGTGFNEISYFGDYAIDRLRRANGEMSAAYEALDRERFRKAAASFAEVVADWGITWKPTSSQFVAEQGGAA